MRVVLILLFALNLFALKIEFLDTKILPNKKVGSYKFTGISDIAYDKNRDIFYALSDYGNIFELKISIDTNSGKIKNIEYLKSKRLKDFKKTRIVKKRLDSEGIAIDGDDLLISFEGSSRINRYSKDFKLKSRVKLPKDLAKWTKRDLSGDGFEALTYSKKRGFITLREKPLFLEKKGFHTIFDSHGKICSFRVDPNFKAVTEVEILDDGNLLALFREFSFRHLSFMVAIKKIYINSPKNGICEVKTISILDGSKDGSIDNFEGLTRYKKDLYLMISDDNNNIFQKTILKVFRLKDDR